MLSLGAAAALILLVALLIDAVIDPARRVLPVLDRLLRLPGEDSGWFRGLSARTRRITGWVVLGLVGFFALILLLRLQRFLMILPFGDVAVGVLVAPFLSLRAMMRMIGLARAGLSGGQLGVARDGLARLIAWRTVAETPSGIARQAVETGVIGFASGFLMPVLAFLVIGLPGPVLWRLLIGIGSFNPASPGRDRQLARGPDRALMLLLYGPGWLSAWMFALSGLLVRVPLGKTLAYLDRRIRHGEEPLAPAMDAMAFLTDAPLARPVLLRAGSEPGVLLNAQADPADAAVVSTARTVLWGAIGQVVGVLALLVLFGVALLP